MKIAVSILAGGDGRRIGGDKPLRLVGGKTLLDRALVQARQWSDQVAVAVRDEAQLGGCAATVIFDEPGVDGPLAGLISALRFARDSGADAVLTLPTDMPFLPPNLCGRLRAQLGDSAAAVASSGGHLHPVCALWRLSSLDVVPAYVASGRRSLRGFAEAAGFAAVDWRAEPIDPFFNINSPEDLAAAERLLPD